MKNMLKYREKTYLASIYASKMTELKTVLIS
jgi:hypothetical protein